MKNYTEQRTEQMWAALPFPIKQRLMAIAEECDIACTKFPHWPHDNIHRAAIVAEEAGELIQAALQSNYEKHKYSDMTTEAVQTGAMALRFLIHCEPETEGQKWIREKDTQALPELKLRCV